MKKPYGFDGWRFSHGLGGRRLCPVRTANLAGLGIAYLLTLAERREP